jgi:thiamine biosynthesis lipoprotein
LIRLAREAMRTRFEILFPEEAGQSAAHLRAAGEEALEEIAAVERRLSVYRLDADLYAVNARAAEEAVRVDARTFTFLREAFQLVETTGGAFDPTVGPLLTLWGLSGTEERLPDSPEIAEALPKVGVQNAVLDEEALTVRYAVPGMRLDPGAIGKGYALGRAEELLRENGIRNALLHGGTSTVCALGAPPETPDGWHIAVQDPTKPEAHLAVAVLRDCSLSVSAVHGKSFWAQGRRFGHVLDPRIGWPVEKTLLAAVVAPSAIETDALSTALLVLGEEGLPVLVNRFQNAGFLVATAEENDDNTVRVVTVGDVWRGVSTSAP